MSGTKVPSHGKRAEPSLLVQVKMLIMCAEHVHHSFLFPRCLQLGNCSLEQLLLMRLAEVPTACSSLYNNPVSWFIHAQ